MKKHSSSVSVITNRELGIFTSAASRQNALLRSYMLEKYKLDITEVTQGKGLPLPEERIIELLEKYAVKYFRDVINKYKKIKPKLIKGIILEIRDRLEQGEFLPWLFLQSIHEDPNQPYDLYHYYYWLRQAIEIGNSQLALWLSTKLCQLDLEGFQAKSYILANVLTVQNNELIDFLLDICKVRPNQRCLEAALLGGFDLFEKVSAAYQIELTKTFCENVFLSGDKKLIEYFNNLEEFRIKVQHFGLNIKSLIRSAENKSYLKSEIEAGYFEWEVKDFVAIVVFGDREFIRWILKTYLIPDDYIAQAFYQLMIHNSGSLETGIWLWENYKQRLESDTSLAVLKKGGLRDAWRNAAIADWMRDIIGDCPSQAILEYIITVGDIAALQRLCSEQRLTGEGKLNLFLRAIANGELEITKFLHSTVNFKEIEDYNKRILEILPRCCNLKVVKWLVKEFEFKSEDLDSHYSSKFSLFIGGRLYSPFFNVEMEQYLTTLRRGSSAPNGYYIKRLKNLSCFIYTSASRNTSVSHFKYIIAKITEADWEANAADRMTIAEEFSKDNILWFICHKMDGYSMLKVLIEHNLIKDDKIATLFFYALILDREKIVDYLLQHKPTLLDTTSQQIQNFTNSNELLNGHERPSLFHINEYLKYFKRRKERELLESLPVPTRRMIPG